MTQQEINESNKLIAEFHGAEFIPDKNQMRYNDHSLESFRGIIQAVNVHADNLKYHTSWDWLMPVIDKAYEIYLNHRGSKWIAEFILTAKHDCFWELKLSSPIGYVWIAVIEFIKWHNQNK